MAGRDRKRNGEASRAANEKGPLLFFLFLTSKIFDDFLNMLNKFKNVKMHKDSKKTP